MPEQDRWQLELSEYIRQGEPDRAEKSAAWQTAIGLQAVDGLKTSTYLLETAKAHIEGEAEVAFIVDKTGAVRDARLLHKIQPELDASILRAVERLPQWKPGRVGGRPVNVRIRIPIHFKAK